MKLPSFAGPGGNPLPRSDGPGGNPLPRSDGPGGNPLPRGSGGGPGWGVHEIAADLLGSPPMCGIAGHLAFPSADPERARRMTAALSHRGPDGEGHWSEGPIALGHRRLAIIDLTEGGAQPMHSADGALTVVFNGEIYNYRELREELRPRRTFRTESDTEVLLHLYEELGEALLPKLRGMFAFALWDARRQRLLAARDPFGEKPLVWTERRGPGGTELSFASELGALRASGGETGSVDRAALSDYLELLYVPAPRTIFQGVRKLPAGHLLVATREGVTVRRYFTPPVPGSRPDRRGDLPARVRAELERAVRLRLRSDVPIAALLSGGIDSSAVVGLMAKELGPGVRTFSVGFGQGDDELPFARAVAKRHQTDHHELVVTGELAGEVVEGLSAHGEPFGDSSAVPTAAVCRAVAREAKVVLTGDGGDELFAGYGRYRRVGSLPHVPFADRAAALAGRAASRYRRAALAVGRRGDARNRALVEVFSLEERRRLLGQDARALPAPEGPTGDVDAAIAFDLAVYLPEDLLPKVDAASMRHGLESRAPFLDQELAALVVPLAEEEKQTATQGKLALRAAVKDLLPEEILGREKRGFGSPVEQWLRGPLRPMLEGLLFPPSARAKSLLDPTAIDAVVKEVARGRGNAHQAWALLALEQWLRR